MERLMRFLIITTIIGLMVISVSIRSKCIKLETTIGKARLEKKALVNEQELLLAEREKLLAFQRIRHLASIRLGLKDPDRKRVVFVLERSAPQGPVDINYTRTSTGGMD